MSLAKLPTLAEVQADRVGKPLTKPLPHQITKQAARQSRDEQAQAFRAAVWTRDQGCSRATGHSLVRSGTMDWTRLGEVDHAIPRSLAPELIYDVANGLLLSKLENRLRKVPCPRAPEFRMFSYEGPDNRREPQIFTWRDADGKVIKRRVG